ncbi:hypothetical protein GCM10009767_16050 [Kocuria aegyptia]|uniref:Uncharacterized protein n=1 Tax=Kocuria aegyptia TaxID=330943 RepID=A0ABN2KJ01_9MICC
MPPPDANSSAVGPAGVRRVMIGLGRRKRTGTDGSAPVAATRAGAHHVQGARRAGGTTARDRHLRPPSATAPVAVETDAPQRAIGAGPAVPSLSGEDLCPGRLGPEVPPTCHRGRLSLIRPLEEQR